MPYTQGRLVLRANAHLMEPPTGRGQRDTDNVVCAQGPAGEPSAA